MKYTGNYNLKKPEGADAVNIEDLNDNVDIIDSELKKVNANKAGTAVATASVNGLMSAADKTKLDSVASGANKYTLPTASSSALGGVKIGEGLNISSGIVSVGDIDGGTF